MALSNWDTLAVGIDSKPNGGAATNHNGVTVEIYKNWLYIRDPQAWQENRVFTNDVVMEITEGTVRYGGWTIIARRGPQEGVYVVAHSNRFLFGDEHKDLSYEERIVDKVLLVGCGVYGYENEREIWAEGLRELGIDPEDDFFISRRYDNDDDKPTNCLHYLRDDKPVEIELPDTAIFREVEFCGVQARSVEFLDEMVKELYPTEIKEGRRIWPDTWLSEIDLGAATRFNQGDAYFADAFGMDTPVSAPEEVAEPIIHDAIKGMKGDLSS